METWEAILVAFGGNAVLLAVLAFLSRSLIIEWLKKAGIDRQITYSKLHEKRIEAISSIYNGLQDYLSVCKSFMMSAQHNDDDQIQGCLEEVGVGAQSFRNVFQQNKLYLTKDLCAQIEKVFKDTQMPSHSYIFALGMYKSGAISDNEHESEWLEAYKAFTENVPLVLDKLENEFRSLLRSEKYS